jgi:uncharacterized protein (TIGR04255 family)
MLGQVRFPPILRILDRDAFAPVQELLRSEYPDLGEETQIGVFLGPAGAAAQTPASRQWRLTSRDHAWSILVAADSLTVEAGVADSYTFEEFYRRFDMAWTALLSQFQPSPLLQQGLRYINHLDRQIRDATWRDWVRPQLLGAIVADEFGDELEQAVCEFRFRRPDGSLVLKHGLVPAGSNRILGYLLDFDYFSQNVREDTSGEALLAQFDRFHTVIYDLFRWCLTERAMEAFMNADGDGS